jgi:ketosteroid isomerase-like protein
VTNPDNAAVIARFYAAFAALDAEAMAACYADDVRFSDPAFGVLVGERARNMWRMLCGNAKELRVTPSAITATGDGGSAHWDAHYKFRTGRHVHNSIDATFVFRDGKIVEHTDVFDLWKWSKQALGLPGTLLGWTPLFRRKMQRQANGLLDGFIAKRG